jgi:hypothetical protein
MSPSNVSGEIFSNQHEFISLDDCVKKTLFFASDKHNHGENDNNTRYYVHGADEKDE